MRKTMWDRHSIRPFRGLIKTEDSESCLFQKGPAVAEKLFFGRVRRAQSEPEDLSETTGSRARSLPASGWPGTAGSGAGRPPARGAYGPPGTVNLYRDSDLQTRARGSAPRPPGPQARPRLTASAAVPR